MNKKFLLPMIGLLTSASVCASEGISLDNLSTAKKVSVIDGKDIIEITKPMPEMPTKVHSKMGGTNDVFKQIVDSRGDLDEDTLEHLASEVKKIENGRYKLWLLLSDAWCEDNGSMPKFLRYARDKILERCESSEN